MSGQASSPKGSFSNVAAGCSMREGSSRSINSSSSNSATAAGAGGGRYHHHQQQPQGMTAHPFGESSNSASAASASSAAGISSSGSSRSTARFSNFGGGEGGGGFASAGGGSSAMQGVISEDGGGGGAAAAGLASSNINVAGSYHNSNAAYSSSSSQYGQNQNNYSSYQPGSNSNAGAPSSQQSASGSNFNQNGSSLSGIPTSSHYSQYTSLPYPYELTVYSWGRGEDGQLGIGDTSDQNEPTYVDSLRGVGVKQIACGSGHTVVLTGEGEVYTWGRGDDGRLGHGDNGWKYVPRLTHSLTGQIITHVTCGSYHTAAVSSNGDLFTWGGGMYGKLGHGNESGHSTPIRVEALVGLSVVDIACGSRHTAVVTNKGCLYTWGDKENGVAGHGDTEGHQYTPKLLERLSGKKVVQLSACGFHTGCLTDMGEVYTWGEGKFGRLGHGAERNCHSPRLVESLLGKRPIQIACGGFHSAVVTEDGKMYT